MRKRKEENAPPPGAEKDGGSGSPSGAASLDLDLFPVVREEARPRAVYFQRDLSLLDSAALINRGYEPINLLTMPRRTEAEHRVYLLAKAQAMEEQTISANADDLDRMRLEMQAFGMFNNKSTKLNFNVHVGKEDVTALLNWGKDRHTLRDNTTIVGVSELMLHGEMTDEMTKKLAEVERRRQLMERKHKETDDGDDKISSGEGRATRTQPRSAFSRPRGRPPVGR